ncbi:kinase-like protein [Laetiporus sulphureus 93-53]|uniref:Kinase-like protein n=1 Tax=Laetiporus sulphureus 93-53 TaxID=1314785 RepID=A0A165IIL3_9APHY|nr:kinase-like protein [Laetiporus sulphureus 93-53]KZT13125.1 kinase-like protein [Laetiporus sulphureus 93-53]
MARCLQHLNGDYRGHDPLRPGGYHPIIIGDIIGSSPRTDSASKPCQYRIMHKLGFGSYATALWLAQKTDSSGAFVAVKITTAADGHIREAQMLEAASTVMPNGQPSPHIMTLLDHFTLRGPNGAHSVLVTDVVAPIVSFPSPGRSPHWRKAFAYGLAQGLAHLHATGIVHGDLHLGNVGFAMPQLAHQDEDDVMQDLSPYDLTIVLPCSAAKQTRSLPAYVVALCHLTTYYEKLAGSDPPVAKIFDFGNAHKAGTPPLNFQCAVEACAPELGFARPPADVWALGAVIYEIVTGAPMFHGDGMPALPYHMSEMAGYVPSEWQSWRPDLTISPDQADAWWTSRKTQLRRGCVDDKDTDALVRLLKKVLVLDAAIRPTIAVVLQDPWFHDDAAHQVQG